jgi:ubiquinone/menaquinone biosynthesis C-methylase UbiE
MKFQDLFSNQAKAYAQFRPKYPESLFKYLAGLTDHHDLVWDVGTGNGQAAAALAKFYKNVVASDPSYAQIENAVPHERIQYLVGAEEQPAIQTESVDMVTIAQALHWFEFDSFFEEVRRVARPRGICAAWSYDFNLPIQPDLDAALNKFYFETLGPYWAPNNKLIWNAYRDIPFPFDRIDSPKFLIEAELNLVEFIGYLSSWSSTSKYIEQTKSNPLEELFDQIQPLWGDPTLKKNLQWDLHILVGKT